MDTKPAQAFVVVEAQPVPAPEVAVPAVAPVPVVPDSESARLYAQTHEALKDTMRVERQQSGGKSSLMLPLIALAVVGAGVGFYLWRRKASQSAKASGPVTPLYTGNERPPQTLAQSGEGATVAIIEPRPVMGSRDTVVGGTSPVMPTPPQSSLGATAEPTVKVTTVTDAPGERADRNELK